MKNKAWLSLHWFHYSLNVIHPLLAHLRCCENMLTSQLFSQNRVLNTTLDDNCRRDWDYWCCLRKHQAFVALWSCHILGSSCLQQLIMVDRIKTMPFTNSDNPRHNNDVEKCLCVRAFLPVAACIDHPNYHFCCGPSITNSRLPKMVGP